LVVFFTSLFLSSLLFGSPALAQETGLRLVTSPLPINLVTEPGKTVTTDLTVKNDGTEPETLRIDMMKFRAYEDTGSPLLMDPEPGDAFFDWVTFSEREFTIAAQERKTVKVTIAVPETASFGYYYAFVFTRAKDKSETAERQTAVVGGTATLVLLEARVAEAKRELTVSGFSVDRRAYEFLPVRFAIPVRNSGNVHIAPAGSIFIMKGDDQVAELPVNAEKGNILPDSLRTYESRWDDGFPLFRDKVENGTTLLDEQGNPEREIVWNFENAAHLRFGKYAAKLLLVYDDGLRDVPVEGEVEFYVVPWRLVLFGIALPVVPALLVYAFMRFRLRRLRREISEDARTPARGNAETAVLDDDNS
jgi:hypothetical protein